MAEEIGLYTGTLAPSIIDYFKSESQETGIPYQTLINLYLADCVKSKRKLEIAWK